MTDRSRELLRNSLRAKFIRIVRFEPCQEPSPELIGKDFGALRDAVGGDPAFLGVCSHENGLDELSLIYNADQSDEALAPNRAGIRGAILGVRNNESGESISLHRTDVGTLTSWLDKH